MNLITAVNAALHRSMEDPATVLLGQLVKYGLGGLTTGLYDKFPDRVLTFPVAENMMHAAAMGLALSGMRPIVVNERMDFLALAMDPLVNHIPVWPLRDNALALPVVVMAVVGKGKGQGPQHSKNLTHWFRGMDGWEVVEPRSPEEAWLKLIGATQLGRPVLYVLHREFFLEEGEFCPPAVSRVGLCGASERHEREFYSQH